MTTLLRPRQLAHCKSSLAVDSPNESDFRLKRLLALLANVTDVPLLLPADWKRTTLPYVRTLLHQDDRCEIASAHWIAGRSCVLHGHSGSAVLFKVLSGMLVEERYVPDGQGGYRYEKQSLGAGMQSYLSVGTFHRLRCVQDAATVHAFDPPPTNAVEPVPTDLLAALAAARRAAATHVS